ncbi:hypothetical protein VTK56DRAFT_7693 [Thermocarpiscus australiensis]
MQTVEDSASFAVESMKGPWLCWNGIVLLWPESLYILLPIQVAHVTYSQPSYGAHMLTVSSGSIEVSRESVSQSWPTLYKDEAWTSKLLTEQEGSETSPAANVRCRTTHNVVLCRVMLDSIPPKQLSTMVSMNFQDERARLGPLGLALLARSLGKLCLTHRIAKEHLSHPHLYYQVGSIRKFVSTCPGGWQTLMISGRLSQPEKLGLSILACMFMRVETRCVASP